MCGLLLNILKIIPQLGQREALPNNYLIVRPKSLPVRDFIISKKRSKRELTALKVFAIESNKKIYVYEFLPCSTSNLVHRTRTKARAAQYKYVRVTSRCVATMASRLYTSRPTTILPGCLDLLFHPGSYELPADWCTRSMQCPCNVFFAHRPIQRTLWTLYRAGPQSCSLERT